jgi:hypothetical protein
VGRGVFSVVGLWGCWVVRRVGGGVGWLEGAWNELVNGLVSGRQLCLCMPTLDLLSFSLFLPL